MKIFAIIVFAFSTSTYAQTLKIDYCKSILFSFATHESVVETFETLSEVGNSDTVELGNNIAVNLQLKTLNLIEATFFNEGIQVKVSKLQIENNKPGWNVFGITTMRSENVVYVGCRLIEVL